VRTESAPGAGDGGGAGDVGGVAEHSEDGGGGVRPQPLHEVHARQRRRRFLHESHCGMRIGAAKAGTDHADLGRMKKNGAPGVIYFLL
jgi:hypothetical protein